MSIINLQNIRKSFSDGLSSKREILRGVDLAVESGEFIAIMGRSGSGKTTLLSILSTTMEADSGIFLFDSAGIDKTPKKREMLRSKHIGFMFQEHRLLEQYTILENVMLPLFANSPTTTLQQYEYALSLLESMDISDHKDKLPSMVSGGEAQRAALCRALVNLPRVLLADEVAGQLDKQNGDRIMELLQKIARERGVAVIMVTHSDDIAAYADKIYRLENGVLNAI